jgi:predicted Zn-dependent protease
MNSGDLAYEKMNNLNLANEKKDITEAMNEYNAAMRLFPENLEMQFWTAVTLANNKQINKALPMLKKIFVRDKNWKELFRRLEPAGLINISKEDKEKILSL